MKNKVCIVTGGANGIGRCIAETFLTEGAFVAVADPDAVSGAMLAEKHGGENFYFFCGDITEKDIIDRFVSEILVRRDKVDVLVNNACVNRGGLRSCSYEDFNYVLRLGVTAPFYLTQRLAPRFAVGACVVNISSTRAFMSQADTESYTAAKGAITALTHAMSITLGGRVRVNSISPGWIDTGAWQRERNYIPRYSEGDLAQHPAGRVGKPEDIARAAAFLCSDEAGFITGENLTVDGGMTKHMIYHGDFGWSYDPCRN